MAGPETDALDSLRRGQVRDATTRPDRDAFIGVIDTFYPVSAGGDSGTDGSSSAADTPEADVRLGDGTIEPGCPVLIGGQGVVTGLPEGTPVSLDRRGNLGVCVVGVRYTTDNPAPTIESADHRIRRGEMTFEFTTDSEDRSVCRVGYQPTDGDDPEAGLVIRDDGSIEGWSSANDGFCFHADGSFYISGQGSYYAKGTPGTGDTTGPTPGDGTSPTSPDGVTPQFVADGGTMSVPGSAQPPTDRLTGPHAGAETTTYGPPTPSPPEQTPSEQLDADRAESFPAPPTHRTERSTPESNTTQLRHGDPTLLERIELVVQNPTDTTLTETVTTGLHAGTSTDSEGTLQYESLWGADSSTSVTLDPDESTRVAIAGDGDASLPEFVDPALDRLGSQGGDPFNLGGYLLFEIALETQVSDLELVESRYVLRRSEYQWRWTADGALVLLDPRGDVCQRYQPDSRVVDHPGGTRTSHIEWDARNTEPPEPAIDSEWVFEAGVVGTERGKYRYTIDETWSYLG